MLFKLYTGWPDQHEGDSHTKMYGGITSNCSWKKKIWQAATEICYTGK
jgi:hypothetical protein